MRLPTIKEYQTETHFSFTVYNTITSSQSTFRMHTQPPSATAHFLYSAVSK